MIALARSPFRAGRVLWDLALVLAPERMYMTVLHEKSVEYEWDATVVR